MVIKNFIIRNIFALLVVVAPSVSFAVGGYVSAGLGMADVTIKASGSNEDIYDPSISIAGRVGFIFNDMIGFGGAFNSWIATSEDSLGNDNSVSVIPFLLEVNYYPMDGHEGLYFGLNGGIARETQTVTVFGVETVVSESETAYGGQVGWNFALGSTKRHTLGAELKFIYVDGDPQTYNFISALAMYTFWW